MILIIKEYYFLNIHNFSEYTYNKLGVKGGNAYVSRLDGKDPCYG